MSNKKGVDRISLLPDYLLHDILSFLDTTQVVQTCVLSKRWKTLWTHIHTLNFDFDTFPIQVLRIDGLRDSIELDGDFYCLPWKEIWFNSFLFGVLSGHRSECIQKLSYTNTKYYEDGFLTKILSYAPCHKVQELYITTDVDTDHESMWSCLPSFKLLTVLKITSKNVDNLESLVLPCLRILEIKRVFDFYNEDFDEYYNNDDYEDYYEDIPLNEKTFSGCPNLECLVLIDCLFKRARISAPKLEILELCAFESLPTCPEVELCTPNLKSIKFSRVLPSVKSASDLLYIDKVTIAIDDIDWEEEDISQLLRVFHNAVSLTLPRNSTKVIFKRPSLSGCSFHNLRHLKEIKTLGSEETIEVPIGPNTISNFIDCPNLQTYAVDSTITTSLSQLNLQDKF